MDISDKIFYDLNERLNDYLIQDSIFQQYEIKVKKKSIVNGLITKNLVHIAASETFVNKCKNIIENLHEAQEKLKEVNKRGNAEVQLEYCLKLLELILSKKEIVNHIEVLNNTKDNKAISACLVLLNDIFLEIMQNIIQTEESKLNNFLYNLFNRQALLSESYSNIFEAHFKEILFFVDNNKKNLFEKDILENLSKKLTMFNECTIEYGVTQETIIKPLDNLMILKDQLQVVEIQKSKDEECKIAYGSFSQTKPQVIKPPIITGGLASFANKSQALKAAEHSTNNKKKNKRWK